MQPQNTTVTTADALKGQPFGQIWDESQMCPGALRAIAYGREVDTQEATKREARNAAARARRKAKKAATVTATMPEPQPEPQPQPAPPQAPPQPAVIVHGNYRFQTATGRLRYGNVELTGDLRAAGITITPGALHRLPSSPSVVNHNGAFHLTPKALAEFKRVVA